MPKEYPLQSGITMFSASILAGFCVEKMMCAKSGGRGRMCQMWLMLEIRYGGLGEIFKYYKLDDSYGGENATESEK